MTGPERGWQRWFASWAGLLLGSSEKACVSSKQAICAGKSKGSSVSESSAPVCRIWAPTRNTCGTSGGETGPPRYRREKLHQACAKEVRGLEAPLITCEAVIAEGCYLLRNLPGAPEAVIENVAAGIFQVPFQLSREAVGVKQVLRKYRDRRIDLADACLIRLADEFGTADILTLDKDFQIYRWGKNKPFRILLHLN